MYIFSKKFRNLDLFLTFTIDNSKNGGAGMSSIDLVILGIVLEKPQSAYDIQKDVEYHHFDFI